MFVGSLCCGKAISCLRGEKIPCTGSETISRSYSDLQTRVPLYIQG